MEVRYDMKANRTKGKILDTSIKLFNEKKASNVSTVQISAAMKISPGNLYYYYANKEEVIRCIWQERMLKEIDQLIIQYEQVDSAGSLLDFFKDAITHCIKYKFFYTEMPTLFVNDSSLIDIYGEVEKRIRNASVNMYKSLAEEGKAAGLKDEILDMVAYNGMAMLIGVVSYCDVMSLKGFDINDSARVAWERMACYMKPFFTEEGQRELDEALKARGVEV